MSVYLIRHGSTEMNMKRLIQGHTDVPLCEEGKDQARFARNILKEKGIRFSKVFSSPLIRAHETASIISGLPSEKVEILPFCIEIDFGRYDGRSLIDITEEEREVIFSFSPEAVEKNGAESYEGLMARVDDFLKFTASYTDGSEDILTVSHGGFIRGVLSRLDGTDKPAFWKTYDIPNCKTYKLNPDSEKGYDIIFEGIKLKSSC